LNNSKRILAVVVLLSCFAVGNAQPGFSVSTDVAVMRSFKKDQRYFAIGPTTRFQFHLTPKEEVYVWFAYYTNGKYENKLSASAKDLLTIPQQINYTNNGSMRIRHFSLGWKKYLKGNAEIEKGWSLYSYAGLGIMFGSVTNTHSESIDTALYNVPVLGGSAGFKRLTLDLGLGWEQPLAGDFYIYAEGRALLPTTDYPSPYLFVNNKAPLVGALAAGLRIYF
jgi:hypothetical protein